MKLARRDLAILAVLGLVAVLGGFWWLVVKPAAADVDAQRERLEQVRSESGGLRDTIARLQEDMGGELARTAQRLRMAKALPSSTETPGVIVQLQRLADRAGVELTSLGTQSVTAYGSIAATTFEVKVTGRFLDVDDFMYRMHRQVAVDEQDRPIVGGRLFATTRVEISPEADDGDDAGRRRLDAQRVVATLAVVAFSSAPSTGSAGPSPDAVVPVAEPAPSGEGGEPQPTATPDSAPAGASPEDSSATTSGGAK